MHLPEGRDLIIEADDVHSVTHAVEFHRTPALCDRHHIVAALAPAST